MSTVNVGNSAGVIQFSQSRVPFVLDSVKSEQPTRTEQSGSGEVYVTPVRTGASRSRSKRQPNLKRQEEKEDEESLELLQEHQSSAIDRRREAGKKVSNGSNHESSVLKSSQHPEYQEEFNKIRERLFRILSKVPIQVSSGEQKAESTSNSGIRATSSSNSSTSFSSTHKLISKEPLLIKYYNERSLSEILELHFSCSLIKHNYQLSLSSNKAAPEAPPTVISDYSRVSSSSYDISGSNNTLSNGVLPFTYRLEQGENNRVYLGVEQQQQQQVQYQQPATYLMEQQQQQHYVWPSATSSSSSWPVFPSQNQQNQIATYDCQQPSALPLLAENHERIIKSGQNCNSTGGSSVGHRRIPASQHKVGSSKQTFTSQANGKSAITKASSKASRARILTGSPSSRLPPVASTRSNCLSHYQAASAAELLLDWKQVVATEQNNGSSSHSNSGSEGGASVVQLSEQQFRLDPFGAGHNQQPVEGASQLPFSAHYTYPSTSYTASDIQQHSTSSSGIEAVELVGHLQASFPQTEQHSLATHQTSEGFMQAAEVSNTNIQQHYELEQQPVNYYQQAPGGYQVQTPELLSNNWPQQQQQHNGSLSEHQAVHSVIQATTQQMIDQPPSMEYGAAYLQPSRFYSAPGDPTPHYATTFIYSHEQQPSSCSAATETIQQQVAHQHAINKWNQSAG